MTFEKTLLAAAVAAALMPPAAVRAAEADRVLPSVTAAASRETEVQTRTELGKLTEHTPLAGSVVLREELETVRFVDSFHELLPRVPGVSMSRNLRFTDGGKNYTENRVDGMRARNTGTYTFIDQVNAGDIERIEILRGPGSVLSGSNAIGGTINVITREPPARPEYQASAELLGYGYRAGFSAGAPLSERLGYFVNVNRLDNRGWRDHSEETKDALSTKLLFRPDASSRLAFRLEHLHDDFQEPGTLTQAQFEADWRQAQPGTYYRTDIRYTTPSLHYRKLFGETGEVNVYAQRRITDSSAKSQGFGGSGSGGVTDNEATEDNLQLMYRHLFGLGKGAVTGGLDLLATRSRTWNYGPTGAAGFDFVRGALTGDAIAEERHRSPFLQYEVSPLDPLRLTLGVRKDSLEYVIDDQIKDYKDGKKEYGRVVKKFGAVYELDGRNLLWANLAQGFMGPGVSTLIGSGTPTPASHAAAVASRYVPANPNLRPEDSLTREIGLRGVLGNGLRYDTGYYRTEFRDLIVSEMCGPADLCYTRNVNAASAHASGFETALEYAVTAWLDLGLAHTYTRYVYDDYVSAGTDYSGKERYYTPRNHINLRAVVKPAPGWRIELEMDHIDAYYTNQALTDRYSRPDLYNLRASYTGKSWSFWLHALNLFDTRYAERVGSTDLGVRNSYSAGYTPLTLRLGVSYSF